jgi:hypothetical protein
VRRRSSQPPLGTDKEIPKENPDDKGNDKESPKYEGVDGI